VTPWKAELGDYPTNSTRGLPGEISRQRANICLKQAIEKEVGHDEVAALFDCDVRGYAELCGEPVSASGTEAALLEQVQHARAAIDCSQAQGGGMAQESGSEATISVPEQQGLSRRLYLIKEVLARALQQAAQREIFRPAINSRDTVEVCYAR